MKKPEVITLVSALLAIAGVITYLKLSSRLARAEREAAEAHRLIEYMRQQNDQRTQTPTPAWQPAEPSPMVQPKDAFKHPELAPPELVLLPPDSLEHLLTDTRPTNGTVILNRFGEPPIPGGHGKLTIENGLTEDAFVKVVSGVDLMAAMYVRGNSSFSISKIPDGSYTILYRTGFGWLEQHRDFERGKGAAKFDNNLVYSTEIQNDDRIIRTFYDTFTLTLHKVVDGNAQAEEITDDEFNKYK